MFEGLIFYLRPIVDFIDLVILPLLLAVAFIAFVYGIFVHFIAGGDDPEKRKEGQNLALYAVIGFVLIISLWGIIGLLGNALGFTGPTGENLQNIPSVQ